MSKWFGSIAVVIGLGLVAAGLYGKQLCPLERPNAGREMDLSVGQHRATSQRPRRSEPLVADDATIRRRRAQLPHDAAVLGLQTIEEAIIRTEVNSSTRGDWSEADGRTGKESPAAFSALGFDCSE